MKQIAQNYKTGELALLDVPAPTWAPGGALVRSLYSLVSTGTELMKVGESKMSLAAKARARPEQVKKVIETAQQQGPLAAYRKAMSRLDSYTPLGYSLAGLVVEVGRGAEEYQPGQLVACAGNEFALHAELNWVPSNLCVPVPDGVAPELAAFATVGSIALQGVRQAQPALGETSLVIGLGLVGQLVVQLLVASGARVVGLDTVAERCSLAEKSGALVCATPSGEGLAAVGAAITKATGGLGADHVFLAASGSSNQPVELAARFARDRATVVDIGKTKLDLPWNAYYEKELDFRFSRSYGPGRYDPVYELEGIDYPPGYVRWTERRNLSCFLDLVARGDIDPTPLISGTFPLEEAPDVYAKLHSGELRGVGFLFSYPEALDSHHSAAGRGPAHSSASPAKPSARPTTRHEPLPQGDPVRIGFIGAGNYASSMLLPHLAGKAGAQLVRLATRRSLSAANAKRKFGFLEVGTDVDAVLGDTSVDAVFIVTRHSSHAALASQALQAGKAVFVEKPLALSEQELAQVLSTVQATGNDRLMVGFNRRFAPMLVEMRSRFGRTSEVSVARYFVNAGKLAAGSWYANEELEGSRFAGEGGHFIDTISWWLEADPVEVSATAAGKDALQVSLRYPDGSLASVTYFTNGNPRFPKETMEVASSGRVARLDNFKKATVWCGYLPRTRRALGAPDKGQRGEVEAFIEAVRTAGPMPISLASLAATTRATLAAERSLSTGTPIRI